MRGRIACDRCAVPENGKRRSTDMNATLTLLQLHTSAWADSSSQIPAASLGLAGCSRERDQREAAPERLARARRSRRRVVRAGNRACTTRRDARLEHAGRARWSVSRRSAGEQLRSCCRESLARGAARDVATAVWARPMSIGFQRLRSSWDSDRCLTLSTL